MSALARISHRSRIIALLAFVLAMFASLSPAPQLAQLLPAAPVASAQGGTALGPQSGDVFRQFQDNLSGNQNTTMCNSQPSNCNSGTPFATRATPARAE